MYVSHVVLAYFSPEAFLPVTSVIATVLGVVMMFGRNLVRLAVHYARSFLSRKKPHAFVQGPHFRLKTIPQAQSVSAFSGAGASARGREGE